MPELPEVETIVTGLKQNIVNETIKSAKFSNKQLREPYPSNILEVIINSRIEAVHRKAKYILLQLDNNHNLIIHLGMSGKLLVGKNLPTNKHNHVCLTLSSSKQMIFNDPRRFGLITVVHNNKLTQDKLFKNLGIEPLNKDFTARYLHKLIQDTKAPIKSVIMNSKYIVGVGNIYASESLFRARIHPLRLASSIKLAELKKLVPSIQIVLKEAIKAGGSTLRDYARSNGDIGYFQHYFNVYGKKGEKCPECSMLIEQVRIAGRSTFFCSQCQK